LQTVAATASHSPGTAVRYERRRPEDTVLFDAVSVHLAEFLAFARERSGAALPKYVVREFERYLACGDLSRGVVRVYCERCRHSFVVGFSCKTRGVCPSCCSRRMTGTAASLVDRVLPDVAYRQWVLTAPYALRALLAQKPDVLAAVHRILASEIERAYVATTTLAPAPAARRGGSVTFVQRFSGSLGLHVHFHLVAADGLWVRDDADSPPRFVTAPPPSRETLADVVRRIHARASRWLRRHGYANDSPVEERSNEAPADDALTSCLRVASAPGTLATLFDPPTAGASPNEQEPDDARMARRASKWVAVHEGFNLHAGVTVAQGHREFLERLCRYGARPALALERLTRLPDGRFSYRMKYPLRGHTHRILEPMELMARLASVIPPPRYPLVRFSGVLAGGSAWRKLVVPAPHAPRCCAKHESAVPPASNAPAANAAGVPDTIAVWHPSAECTRIDWASLLRHGFELDALACPKCGSRMRVLETIHDPAQIARLLAHLGVSTRERIPSRAWDPVPVQTG
jgi:hypothetical protein